MTSYTLLPHQIEDARFLADRKFAGCFSGMGSGKTLTALEAARLVHAERCLIIAPPIALRMWASEAETHLGVPAFILKTGRSVIPPGARVVVCSYQIATARAPWLASWAAGGVVICDESHALKSVSAKRTRAVLGEGGVTSRAAHAWMLTGTPSTRWNDDLFTFLRRADPAGLRSRCGGASIERFQRQFCIRQQKQFSHMRFPVWMTVGNRNTEELSEWIYGGGLAVRRELADVWKNMPPLTKTRYTIDLDWGAMSREEQAQVKAMDKLPLSQIENMKRSNDPALATVRRCIGMGKVHAALAEIRERLEGGQGPILVGAWHTSVIDALGDGFESYRVRTLDGRTTPKDRKEIEDLFNAGELDVLIGQIGAMGVSLNLQKGGAHYIVVVEEDWSPAIMEQFYARLHRIGQRHHVHVDVFAADLKIEQAVGRIAHEKAKGHVALAEHANL